EPLILEQYVDETIVVTPKEGSRFVAIPFRYRTDISHEIRRATFDVRTVPPGQVKFMGFRAMVWADREPVFSQRSSDPIYERLQITRAEDSTPASLIGINQTHPARSGEKEAGRQQLMRNRISCTGWAAAIIEVPRAMDVVSIAVGRGPAQDISISLLDRAQKSRAGSHAADSANVRRWGQRLAADSPAAPPL